MGAFMNLNFLLAGTLSSNPMMLATQAVIVWAGMAAGYYGLDYFVRPWLQATWQRLKARSRAQAA